MRRKIVYGFIFFLLAGSIATNAQKVHKIKIWFATINLESGRVKGELYNVSDSSLTILGIDRRPDEIFFNEITSIKLRRVGGRGIQRTVGVIAGSALGAWGSVAALTKGRSGEPAALAGVVGGIGGGIIGGTIGFFAAPGVYNLFTVKKFEVKHDPSSYSKLKQQLTPYTQTTQ